MENQFLIFFISLFQSLKKINYITIAPIILTTVRKQYFFFQFFFIMFEIFFYFAKKTLKINSIISNILFINKNFKYLNLKKNCN